VGGFFDAVWNNAFMQYALLTAVLASIAAGIVGTYVVARRITYMAGGIAHSVLGGMGAAYYLHQVHHWTWLRPLYGAVIAAVIAALVIGIVSLRAREREDTVIGGVWAVGMAIGIIFISQTPGYNQDLMSYLFGNILMVAESDLWLIAALDALVLVIGLLFYNQIMAVCFDEEFARVRGVNVAFYFLILLLLTALTVVILVTVVGIVMVIALLTIPAATAGRVSQILWKIMALATLTSAVIVIAGLAVSYGPNLPAGATIVLLFAIFYGLVVFVSWLRRRVRA